jgi:hypothetical protein
MKSKAFPGACREVQRILKRGPQILHVLLQEMLFLTRFDARSFLARHRVCGWSRAVVLGRIAKVSGLNTKHTTLN